MRLGKLDNDELTRLVLDKFSRTRPEAQSAPEVGVDCAVLDLFGDLAVLSCDPITSASLSQLGRLSVHVSCNDAAAAGATPVGLLVTLLAPPYAEPADIGRIADDLAAAARDAGVDILGGHTEVTDAVARFVTNTTVLARMPKGAALPGLREGDALVLTKWAGLEGTAIIAEDRPALLSGLDASVLSAARGFVRFLSVVPEGRIAAANGASMMHDVTEGGVLGACWEMGFASKRNVTVAPEAIPVRPETAAICRETGLDPLRLIGSGALLIGCADGPAMVAALEAAGVPAAVIGRACAPHGEADGDAYLFDERGTVLEPPAADELYRLFS